MRFSTLAWVVLVVACVCGFAVLVPAAGVEREGGAGDRPVVYLYQQASMGKGKGGMVCAVWGDGVVLSSDVWAKGGEEMRVGKLRGSVADLEKRLKADGLSALEPISSTVPDGASFTIGLMLDGKQGEYSWDERIVRGYGANNKPDDAYRALVAGWVQTKITLVSLGIEGSRPIAAADLVDGAFRGYVVDEPYRTKWLSTPVVKKK